MPVCSGGSRIKPGAPSYVHVDPTYAPSLLPAQVSWLVPFLPYIPPLNVDLTGLCATDPPDLPVLTPTDIQNLLAYGGVGTAFVSGQKFAQLLHYYAWYAFCECVGTSTPPPTGQSEPTGSPRINPDGFVSIPTAPGACVLEPCGLNPPTTVISTGTFSYCTLSFGANVVRTVRLQINHATAGSTHPLLTFRIDWGGAVSNITSSSTFSLPPNQLSTYDFAVPAGAITKATLVITAPSASSDLVGSQLEAFCQTFPGSTTPVECGPDPRTIGLLEQIWQLLTLVQRYTLPFGYISGAVHSGLSGTGSFAVSRLVGIRVQITAHTTTKPDLEGNPPYVWDQGWMSVSTPDGMIEEKRISQSTFTWFPKLMDLATTFGYELRAGTIATFTELEAEP